ncbi:hypothetical protein [Nocardia sp. CA-290969]|uniref:hypothetical protein n=1 Tax=Nocardia sp. CA-290969 TaxID=3239986 RepID=UPI003D8C34CF
MAESYILEPSVHLIVDEAENSDQPGTILYVTSGSPGIELRDGRLIAALAALPAGVLTEAGARDAWRSAGFDDIIDELWGYLRENSIIIERPEIWHEKSPYHRFSADHPFLDMAQSDARSVDTRIMDRYLADGDYPAVFLDMESEVSFPLERVEDLEYPQIRSDPNQQISLIYGGTFGLRRHLAAYHDPEYDYTQMELIFKHVPSGGSRHPTEAFVVVRRSAMIGTGVYHFSVRTNGLRLLNGLDESILTKIGLELPEADPAHSEDHVVIFVSAVHRAMWRYRDPRSFRALLVDIGHLEGQLAALATYCGWAYGAHTYYDTGEFAELIGLPRDRYPALAVGTLRR